MKIVNSRALCIVGILFFIQAGFIGYFFAKEPKPYNGDNYEQMKRNVEQESQYVLELRIEKFVTSYSGSLVGCFGAFLLLVYLKVRALEKRIEELQNDKQRVETPCSSAQ